MASMTAVKCACCKKEFQARTADIKRGWGKFCSKSCKASEQEKRTGQHRAHLVRAGERGQQDEFDQMHEQAMHDSTQGWDEGGWLNC